VTRSTRTATLLNAYALHRLSFAPVGGPPGPLESPCAPSAWELLLSLTVGGCHRIFLAHSGRRLEGALHVTAHGYGKRWEIVRTAEPIDDCDWLPDALQATTVAAALAGIGKIVARIGHDDPRLIAFEDAGFRPYSQETVFAMDIGRGPAIGGGFNIRAFCKRDEWTFQRLYAAMTPPNVRQTEITTQREFLEPFARGRGIVVERGGELLAAAGSLPRRPRDTALVRLIVRVDAVAAGEAALLATAQRLAAAGVQQALLPVREYMADCLAAARLAGMTPLCTRAVLVKHTAALVRPPVFARLREGPAAMPAVNGTRLVHNGSHVPQCRLRNEARPRRREAPVSVA
jgi:hypothetical protein